MKTIYQINTLTTINFSHNLLTNYILDELDFQQYSNLSSLDLSYNYFKFDNSGLKTLQNLQKLKHLKKLNLSSFNIKKEY